MRKITVHFKNEFIVVFQCPLEARAVGTAEAVFLLAMEYVNEIVFGGQLVGQFARAVGGAVVHHQQVHR